MTIPFTDPGASVPPAPPSPPAVIDNATLPTTNTPGQAGGAGNGPAASPNNHAHPTPIGSAILHGAMILRVRLAASVAGGAVNNAFTVVPFDTVDEDTAAGWSAVNHNFVAPSAGLYDVRGVVFLPGAVGANQVAVGAAVAGAFPVYGSGAEGTGSGAFQTGWPLAVYLRVALGQAIDLRVFQASGVAVQITGGSFLEIVKVSD